MAMPEPAIARLAKTAATTIVGLLRGTRVGGGVVTIENPVGW